jgi:hypothetical protein
MDPAFYQTYSKNWWPIIEKDRLLFLDMIGSYDLGKCTFKSFDPSSDLKQGTLVVIRADKYSNNLLPNIVDRIDYPDNSPAFYLLSYVQVEK